MDLPALVCVATTSSNMSLLEPWLNLKSCLETQWLLNKLKANIRMSNRIIEGIEDVIAGNQDAKRSIASATNLACHALTIANAMGA